jgi:hypothetical protein
MDESEYQSAILMLEIRIEQLEAALLVALGMLSEMGLSAGEKCELAYEHLLKIKIASAALGEKKDD